MSEFWSSDKLTGSQTELLVLSGEVRFWSSDKLTGSQTEKLAVRLPGEFWSSDKLTGSQTRSVFFLDKRSFGVVTN